MRAVRPFLTRLILPFAGMIALVVGVCGVVIYVASQHAARAQQIDELARLTKLVREQISNSADAGSITPEHQKHVRELAEVLATRVTLIDSTGKVVLDTQADA